MPLVGYEKECDCPPDFQTRNGKGVEVDAVEVDHYALRCPEPPIPRILAHALYQSVQSPRYGSEGEPRISATMLTGCPLATYFNYKTDYIEKVLDGRWRLRGTFAHEGILGCVDSPDWIVEQPLRLTVDTEDGPVPLYGTPDAHHIPSHSLFDLKTQREYALTRKNKATDDELQKDTFVRDNMTQLNVYRVMGEEGDLLHPDTYDLMGPAKWTVGYLELQYMDGGLRVRPLEVPILDKERMMHFIRQKVTVLNRVLSGDMPVERIPVREWDGFDPVKKSGVGFRVVEERRRRAA